jgi:hypothetical protein
MRSEKRRVGALTAAINPKGSFRATLATLTDEQRGTYQGWRDRTDAWRAAKADNAYERMINGDEPPPLRHDVQHALFGAAMTIPADATEAAAADAYSRVLNGD